MYYINSTLPSNEACILNSKFHLIKYQLTTVIIVNNNNHCVYSSGRKHNTLTINTIH